MALAKTDTATQLEISDYYQKCGKLQDELSSMRKMDNELKDELRKLAKTAPVLPPQPDTKQTYIQGRFDEEYCNSLDNSIKTSENEKEILGAFFDKLRFELYDISQKFDHELSFPQFKDVLEDLLTAPREAKPPERTQREAGYGNVADNLLREEKEGESHLEHPLSGTVSPSEWPVRTRQLRRIEKLAQAFHERISYLPWFIQSRMARAFRGMLTNQASKMNPNDYLRFLIDRVSRPFLRNLAFSTFVFWSKLPVPEVSFLVNSSSSI
ncbi:unnamed protein product [Dibothriocephalus latus]|uniref:Uncharacterized protein n=1 Tax=Dibothriocephalus latus TaxID=60516 RepID=A0A3P7NV43_DIBLA|nr:unnamed protein product [Dibothriocephalus latus]